MTIEDKTKNLEKMGFSVERRRNKSVVLRKDDGVQLYNSLHQAHTKHFGY